MLKITIVNSKTPTEKRSLELEPEKMVNGECFIGRSRHCGIVLTSSEVSRVHGSIGLENGQYCFTDFASLGGSFLNHNEVTINQRYPLRQLDIIRIGEYILTLDAIEGDIPSPPPAEPQKTTAPAPQPAAGALFVPQPSAAPIAPVLDPKEYMPVALIPTEQMGYWTKGDLTVQCVEIIDETHDAKTFRFVANPPILFDYQPGQFVTLKLDIDGKLVKRSYSISSTPSRPHTLEITVKRNPPPPDAPDAPPGLVSNWLHDNLKVGHQVNLSGPLGKFTSFANPSQKLLLISAGSGITPMMSMSRWVMDTASTCDIVFFHSARTPKDIIYWKELSWMSEHNPRFKLAIAISRPGDNQAWWGFTGRLNPPMLFSMAPDFMQRTVYVCGSGGFMKGTKAMLEELGFPMENYYEESFGGPKKGKKAAAAPATAPTPAPATARPTATPAATPTATPTPAPAGDSFTVVFSKSGQEVKCDGSTPILDIAEEEGIDIDSSCRSGVCGTCKVKKSEGEINYDGDPDALDDDEQEAGYILACIACPAGRVVIQA